MTGLATEVGSIAVGQMANLVAVDRKGKLIASMLGGRLADTGV